jgi:hypothetical protein
VSDAERITELEAEIVALRDRVRTHTAPPDPPPPKGEPSKPVACLLMPVENDESGGLTRAARVSLADIVIRRAREQRSDYQWCRAESIEEIPQESVLVHDGWELLRVMWDGGNARLFQLAEVGGKRRLIRHRGTDDGRRFADAYRAQLDAYSAVLRTAQDLGPSWYGGLCQRTCDVGFASLALAEAQFNQYDDEWEHTLAKRPRLPTQPIEVGCPKCGSVRDQPCSGSPREEFHAVRRDRIPAELRRWGTAANRP